MSDAAERSGSAGSTALAPDRRRSLLNTVAALAGLYACGGTLGFTIFALLFKAGILGSMSVLFFRGLLLAALAFVSVFLVLLIVIRGRLSVSAQDAFSAAVLSLAFNICFLVVVPVTVDRSISVFVLGAMANEPDRLFASDDIGVLFTKVYLGEYRQIDRRLGEQTLTGNVEKIDDAYRISPRGQAFIAFAKWSTWIFGGDTRFVSPPRDRSRQEARRSAERSGMLQSR